MTLNLDQGTPEPRSPQTLKNLHPIRPLAVLEPPNEPSKRERVRRATAAPAAFHLTDEHRAFAKERGFEGDLEQETAKFLDHHCATGKGFRNWEAAWRNWIRKAIEYSRPRAPQHGHTNQLPYTDRDLEDLRQMERASA